MSSLPIVRIAIIGDFDPDNETHRATDSSLAHAASSLAIEMEATWLATDSLASVDSRAAKSSATPPGVAIARLMDAYDGAWIAPGSPYRDMNAVLSAIRQLRTTNVPTFGTCGGFQHIALEYGRHVLGLADAQHAEYDPYASVLFVSRLACSLVGRRMSVRISPGTLAARLYGREVVEENYYCNFALAPHYQPQLVEAGVTFAGVDEDGDARIVELASHPFFLATLFVPQVASTTERPHPLILGFAAAAAEHARRR